MSTTQAGQVSDTIDASITTAQFLKNWTAGRYRNLIDWGTVNAGTRVTAEQQILDKKGKPTGKWRPVSLLLTDLTARTAAIATTGTQQQILTTQINNVLKQIVPGPPTGKTNWKRIMVQNTSIYDIYLMPDSSSVIGGVSTIMILGPQYFPYSGSPSPVIPQLFFDDFGSSIWAGLGVAASIGMFGFAYA